MLWVPFSIALLLAAAQRGSAFRYPNCETGPLSNNLVCDASASPAARAAALVAAMPLSDKLQNLVDHRNGSNRLHLPNYEWWSEALHGVAESPGVMFAEHGEFSYATSFPMPILFSAAFDDQLVEDIATVVSTEARAFSNAGRAGLDFFTPNINPYKDPRWGRGAETPGEDPFRIMGYVKHLLIGLEGGTSPPIKRVIATCKHYTGYDFESWDGIERYGFDALITSQDLAGYYMPPFQQCARDSKVGSIMCSYNAVNSVPTCASSYLINDILRKHWGWENDDNPYITSDCNAVQNIYANHIYVKTAAEAVGVAWNAGTDNACEAGYPTDVEGAYKQGLLTEKVIDQSLLRMFESLVIAGYFDAAEDNPYRSIGWEQVNTPPSQALARRAASESMVLLKNDGILPMTIDTNKKVTMIGMWANATTAMQGSYSGIAPYLHSPLYAAEQLGIKFVYADGPVNETTTHGNWTHDALAAAEDADIILYFGGIDASVESEGMDRYQIGWPGPQIALIESISSMGKPCIVLQMGDQLDDTPFLQNENISAIIWAGYPGQDGGPAIFDVLTGAVAPAGRLPVTQYPADYVDDVALTNMQLAPGKDNPGRTYMWYDDAVVPYGYGLHYTTFEARFGNSENDCVSHGSSYNIQELLSFCSATYPDLCNLGQLFISVSNTGTVTSDFVILTFVRTSNAGPAPYPLKTLAGYTRLKSISADQVHTAHLALSLGSIARRDTKGNLVLYPGDYDILLDVPTQDIMSFTLLGEQVVLEEWPQPPANETYEATSDCPLQGPCHGQPIET